MEILNETETMFKAKIKGIAEDYVKKWPGSGVTVEEYLGFFEQLLLQITKYLGLEYKQRIEGDWIVFTVSEKK